MLQTPGPCSFHPTTQNTRTVLRGGGLLGNFGLAVVGDPGSRILENGASVDSVVPSFYRVGGSIVDLDLL